MKNSYFTLACFVVLTIAQTTEAYADDDNDTTIAISVPASAALVADTIALNLGPSLTFTQKYRQLDVGIAAGKGIDGPTLSANIHAGFHNSGSRSYLLAGYRFARYSDTSESFDPVSTHHLLSARLGLFLPKSSQFRIRLEGELGVPVISVDEESGIEDEIQYLNVGSLYAGVSVALSYSFR